MRKARKAPSCWKLISKWLLWLWSLFFLFLCRLCPSQLWPPVEAVWQPPVNSATAGLTLLLNLALALIQRVIAGWGGTWGEGCHSVFLCQLYGSHYSRLLFTCWFKVPYLRGRINLGLRPKQGRCWRFWVCLCPQVVIHKGFNLLTTQSPTAGQCLSYKRCSVSVWVSVGWTNDTNQHSLSSYCVQGTAVSVFHAISHLILHWGINISLISPLGRFCYYSHFPYKDTEVLRSTCHRAGACQSQFSNTSHWLQSPGS